MDLVRGCRLERIPAQGGIWTIGLMEEHFNNVKVKRIIAELVGAEIFR